MNLLFVFLIAQVRFDWGAPIELEINHSFSIDQITVMDTGILLRDESAQVVYVLGLDGKLKTKLGMGQDDRMVFPYSVSWSAPEKRIYVYDAGRRSFLAWGPDGSFLRRFDANYDRLFRVGELVPIADGFIAPVSLVEGRFLVGKFSADFQAVAHDYELVDPGLAQVAPVFRQTYLTQVAIHGQTMIIAAQKLSQRVALYDGNLKYQRSMTLNSKGWNEAKIKKLEKVTGKPKALERYRESLSEIDSLESLGGAEFIIGIRNLSGARVYTFQCYDAANGLPVGDKHETSYHLAGARGKQLFFADPDPGRMVLFPCQVIGL